MQSPTIKHPFVFLCVLFGVITFLQEYGVTDGTMYILDIFLGMALYKLICSWFV